MNTILHYLNDMALTEYQSEYQEQGDDELGHYIVLNSTIFYPQGGGQPADQGVMTINKRLFEIHHVRMIQNQVRHYTNSQQPVNVGDTVYSQINSDKRLKHSRLHTAGHLLSNTLEKMYPEWIAVKGHHFPGEAYVEFKAKQSVKEIEQIHLNNFLNETIEENPNLESLFIPGKNLGSYCPNLPYSIPDEEQIRLIRIGDYPFQPCGGTHLRYLKALGRVQLIKSKIKQDRLKISYDLV